MRAAASGDRTAQVVKSRYRHLRRPAVGTDSSRSIHAGKARLGPGLEPSLRTTPGLGPRTACSPRGLAVSISMRTVVPTVKLDSPGLTRMNTGVDPGAHPGWQTPRKLYGSTHLLACVRDAHGRLIHPSSGKFPEFRVPGVVVDEGPASREGRARVRAGASRTSAVGVSWRAVESGGSRAGEGRGRAWPAVMTQEAIRAP